MTSNITVQKKRNKRKK